MSNQLKIIESDDDIDKKEIYFMILKQTKKKEKYNEFNFTSAIKPQIIYEKQIAIENKECIDHKVFKFTIKENRSNEQEETPLNNYQIKYQEGNNNYIISFSAKNNSFIYDIELKQVANYLNEIIEETFDQNIIPLYNKLDIFIEALKLNNENQKIEKLYEDTIELYENKKYFTLLISLFIKTYKQNKNLCSKLLAIFNKINENDNKDFIYSLGAETEKFNSIFSEADNIIKNYEYAPVHFYGILLSFFNYYDINNNFSKKIKKLYENNSDLLYEILITYYSYFSKSLNQDLEFYDNLIRYLLGKNKEFNKFEKILIYLDDLDIESYLYIINKNKEGIIKEYDEHRFKPIIIQENLKLIKKDDNKEIENIIKTIKEIINFSKEKNILLIYLKSTFWKNIIKQYDRPDIENINNCYELRLLFKKYNNLINILYKDIANNNKEYNYIIKNDINKYSDRDEFAFILNKNIKEICEREEQKYSDSQILDIIEQYNPIYNIKDEDDNKKYKNFRETYIFDYINFHNITKYFKETFHTLNFETIFKDNIIEFINKLTSKIVNISTFGNIIDLIDISRIKDNIKDYYDILKLKYEYVIKHEISVLKEEEKLAKAIEILCKFIIMVLLEEKNNNFLEEKISKLNDKIKILIYNEIIKRYQDEKYKGIKEFIYDILINKSDNIDNIIKLIDSLSYEEKNNFIIRLLDKCTFTKEEFYTNDDNKKIKLLCDLNERGKLEFSEIYSCSLIETLDEIKDDIDTGMISKKTLEKFLGGDKGAECQYEEKIKNSRESSDKMCNKIDLTIKKLALIKVIISEFDPLTKYHELKKIRCDINETIEKLKFIKDSLIIYHKNKYRNEIMKIVSIINDIENKPIREFKNQEMKESIKRFLCFMPISDEINKVKDFLFFNEIYKNTQGRDEAKRFEDAVDKLNEIKRLFEKNSSNIEMIFEKYGNIFQKIKEKLSKKDEYITDKFIEQMIDYFDIKDIYLRKDLTTLIKSKKYEVIIRSIKYFFECLNKKFEVPKNLALSEMNLNSIKMVLHDLKCKNNYDYQSNYKIFMSFYGKREAIDFLLSKINVDINNLKCKLDPTNRNISIKDIDDTNECLKHFKKIINLESNDIISYIKILKNEDINKFINYSKHYDLIIDLDRKNTKNIFEDVYKIIEDANLIIKIDNEDITYRVDGKYFTTNIENLINLKNKINISPKSFERNKFEEIKDIYQIKIEKLLFFKHIISELEEIFDKIKILRIKGCIIPISIHIKMRYPESTILINNKEKNFEDIKTYLSNLLIDYEHQLNTIYQCEKYIRFLYGDSFRRIKMHQNFSYDISGIMRYILNKIDSRDKIIDGDIYDNDKFEDYFNEYHEYSKNSFNNISHYLISLFKNNNLNLQKHYENILIKGTKNLKGIYIEKCENISMEEYIINLFNKNLDTLPIAQNILICSKDTSFEEIQSFFYRAILCEYNTLFVIEIQESFSKIQQNKMCNCIDEILSEKFEKHKNDVKENKNINKLNTKEYLNSCIYFVYSYSNNDFTYLNKLSEENYQRKESLIDEDNISSNSNLSDNIKDNDILDKIKVITSDVCGLGKSFKIKKLIMEECKCYYHFPLGGMLKKKIIYEKLLNLFDRIKNDSKNKMREKENIEREKNIDYKNIAIHLDLLETRDISLINEFLFSFLITKFYIYNGDILYIPKDLEIFIEIPNSFENYLTRYGILNIFNRENIIFGELKQNDTKNVTNIMMLPLELPSNIINIFKRIIGINSNQEIEQFIKENIGIKEYSYHQVIIFIKIFISQYSKNNLKISFTNSKGENINNQLIKYMSETTKYFTNGSFSKYLIKNRKYSDNNYFDPYEDDFYGEYYNTPLVFIDINAKKYSMIDLSYERHNMKNNKVFNEKPSYKFLKQLKEIFCLPNDIEKNGGDNKSLLSILNSDNNNYIITEDNFRKMILIIYRIQANIPVIIMGETGCGKTLLIKKLNQILNNGNELLEIINIHPGVTDEILNKFMDKINDKAKNIKKELWILFDEINTCSSFSMVKEIFINRTYNGKKLENNIRLIGTCNPFRQKRYEGENEDDILVYKVNQLPQSLFYYIFKFGKIYDEDEKIYIDNIIQKLFDKDEEKLHKLTTEAISNCHIFLRHNYRDPSIVSLRDISRFIKIVEFFQDYYQKKNYLDPIDDDIKKLYKIKSIICSIYLCYYIRLKDGYKRSIFDHTLQKSLLNIVNVYSEEKDEDKDREGDLYSKIKYGRLRDDFREHNFRYFSDSLRIEEEFLLDQIELDEGIGKNQLLKENLFLLFISIITKIPLIIVGKPGTSKTISTQLIYNSMRGKYSKNEFFKKYPQIIQTYFKGSYSTKPEDIINFFNEIENSIEQNVSKDIIPINMIIFDQIDLVERSPTNPLKILNYKLEFDNKNENISFVCISNYTLNGKIMNKALYLSVPNLENKLDQLRETSKKIVEGISDDISYRDSIFIFNILSRAYYLYKYYLNFIKKMIALKQYIKINGEYKVKGKTFGEIEHEEEYIKLLKKERKINLDFHGIRDFYNLIKGVAIEGSKLNSILDQRQIVPIIDNYIERNFGGINYEIDIDFDLEFDDIKNEINRLEEILREYIPKRKGKKRNEDDDSENCNDSEESDGSKGNIIKISSVFLFKKIYNEACSIENCRSHGIEGRIYQIKQDNLHKYNINKCINDNINDNNSRHLLLEITPNLAPLIIQNIRIQNPDIKNIVYINGSPFLEDNNNENKCKQINEILNCVSQKDVLIILQNLNSNHPYLYDLYDKNYKIIDEQKFCRIYLENIGEQLIPVDNSLKIIILEDKNKVNLYDKAFLSRFEKVKINFNDLLDNHRKKLTDEISEEIELKNEINLAQAKISYNLNNLLINCDMENITVLINYLLLENKKIDELKIKEKLYKKISVLLPQDIIINLGEDNPIKREYYYNKKCCNLKEYIKDLEISKKNDFKISIIYTFSNYLEEYNNIDEIEISEIKTENGFKNTIDNIKNKNRYEKKDKKIILIHFEQSDSNKIQFVTDFINNYYRVDEYNYIFIIHIKRNYERESLYSIPNIYKNINQLFIDNLQGPDISIINLMKRNVKDVIDLYLNMDNIFKDVLVKFIGKNINENKDDEIKDIKISLNSKENKYIDEILDYFRNDNEFKCDLIKKVKELIDLDKYANIDFGNLVDKMFIYKYIDKNSIDIISSILDFIKETIIEKYFWFLFKVLKDNSILAELIDNQSDKNKINELKSKALKLIILNDEKK